MSERITDSHNEKIVNQLFINNYCILNENASIRKASDSEDKHGIDFYITNPNINNGVEISVDAKVALNYRQVSFEKILPTFAFELTRTGDESGWLFSDYYQADYYCLQWLWVRDSSLQYRENKDCLLKLSDITRIEYILVSKEEIRKYLSEFNLNSENYLDFSRKARSISSEDLGVKYFQGRKYYFDIDYGAGKIYLDKSINFKDKYEAKCPRVQVSNRKTEKSVNVLISKKQLERMQKEHQKMNFNLF